MAAKGREPIKALRQMWAAYIRFARENSYLYEVMMSFHSPENDVTLRHSLWAFTVSQVESVAGEQCAAEASVALWAVLHGIVALEAARVFGERKPASGTDFALEAWLAAASASRSGVNGTTSRKEGRIA
ncbi:MAG: WHG domain-containing protein [Acidobacteriota bacterium]|nr:WHG domain-containing protein [Acidobacteriota bacterium]